MHPARRLVPLFLLGLCGVALTVYLFSIHLGMLRGELSGTFGCSASGIFNCHAVTGSSWSSFLGMPLSLWGLIGYLTLLQVVVLAWVFPHWRTQAIGLVCIVSTVFVLVDLVLWTIMFTQIRYVCPLCLATYAVNALLVFAALLALGVPVSAVSQTIGAAFAAAPSAQGTTAGWLLAWFMAVVVFVAIGFNDTTTYLTQTNPSQLRDRLRQHLATTQRVQVDVSTDPGRGPEQAVIHMVEFSDFLCPACQRAAQFNDILLASHRHDVRFIFKHFPLDTTCNTAIGRMVHPGACTIAAASECANQQGQFWPFHDLIFREATTTKGGYQTSRLEQDVARLGIDMERYQACLASGEGLQAVQRDIAEAQRLSVTSTPTFFLNGVMLPGILTPAVFDQVVAVFQQTDRR